MTDIDMFNFRASLACKLISEEGARPEIFAAVESHLHGCEDLMAKNQNPGDGGDGTINARNWEACRNVIQALRCLYAWWALV